MKSPRKQTFSAAQDGSERRGAGVPDYEVAWYIELDGREMPLFYPVYEQPHDVAAHLGGVIAAYTTLPVITIPGSGGALKGVEALLSSVEMPPGIPVASVGIDAGQNAALLALSILSVSDEGIAEKLGAYRESMRNKVLIKDREISGRL